MLGGALCLAHSLTLTRSRSLYSARSIAHQSVRQVAICQCDAERAKHLLEAMGWNLEVRVTTTHTATHCNISSAALTTNKHCAPRSARHHHHDPHAPCEPLHNGIAACVLLVCALRSVHVWVCLCVSWCVCVSVSVSMSVVSVFLFVVCNLLVLPLQDAMLRRCRRGCTLTRDHNCCFASLVFFVNVQQQKGCMRDGA
jgi:hypothetical protein